MRPTRKPRQAGSLSNIYSIAKVMTRLTFLFLAFTLLCVFQAQAQNRSKPAAQAKQQPCANAQTQSAMNQCAMEEFKKADAELNKVFQQLLLKTDRQEKLKAA